MQFPALKEDEEAIVGAEMILLPRKPGPNDFEPEAPDAAQKKADRESRLSAIYEAFCKRRDEWIMFRRNSGIEDKWRKWEELYNGNHEEEAEINSFVNNLRNGPSTRRLAANRSRVVVNIVRPKVDQAVGRYAEILLPTDGKNWGIKVPAKPELAEIAKDKSPDVIDMRTGRPMYEVAELIMKDAEAKAKRMEETMEGVLGECDYNGECRKVLQSGTKLGTGIMKGPFPQTSRSKVWTAGPDGQAVMQFNEKTVPVSKMRLCWDIYPDPACGNDIQRGSGIYEQRMVNAKELRNLIGVPGFFEDKIREVLKQDPKKVIIDNQRKVSRATTPDGMYQMWEYHGEINDEHMRDLTAEWDDPLDNEFGMLVIVNDIIIGALESYNPDGRLPYDFWCHRDKDDSPWGDGMPEDLEHQQRVVKSAWRQVMDNAAAAAGYHLIFKKGMVTPYGQTEGQYTIESRMLWEANEEIEDVNKAMAVITIDMRVQELLAVVDAAMKFADQESNMPQLMGGERGTAPETVGGMQILQANAQGPLRFRIKRFDDTITNGQITGHYDWQMEYSEDMSIKGAFEIEARGSTHLLERDIQAQATMNLSGVTSNPRYIPHLDERLELEEILKAMRVNTRIMKPLEKVQEEQAQAQPPQDPKIVAATIAAQSKAAEIAERSAQREANAARDQAQLAIQAQQLDYNRDREQGEFIIAQTQAEIERNALLLKTDADLTLSREASAAKERLQAMKIDNDNALFNAEVAVKVAQGSGI